MNEDDVKHGVNVCCVLADSLRWDTFVDADPLNILQLGEATPCYSCGNSTLPSIMATLMNYPPIGIGRGFFIQSMEKIQLAGGDEQWKELKKWMPRYFKEHGYITMWLSANPVLMRLDSEFHGAFRRYFDYWYAIKYEKEVATPEIIRDLEKLVEEVKDKPIFAVVLLLDTHSPYHDGEKSWLINPARPALNRQRQRKAMKYIDNIFPNFIKIFKKTGRATEFIFTSDHGENLGGPGWGHSSYRSKLTMSQGLFRIPYLRSRIVDWTNVTVTVE